MFEPRPEISTATRFFMSQSCGLEPQIEMPAKADAFAARSGDDLAKFHNRLAVLGETCAGGVSRCAIEHDHHADAAIEGAQHFVFVDVARGRQPFEHRQDWN